MANAPGPSGWERRREKGKRSDFTSIRQTLFGEHVPAGNYVLTTGTGSLPPRDPIAILTNVTGSAMDRGADPSLAEIPLAPKLG